MTLDQLERQTAITALLQKLHEAESFYEVMPEVTPKLLMLLNAERVTVFTKGRQNNGLVSKFLSGGGIQKITVPLSPHSIAGYVGLSQQGVNIQDAHDDAELKGIHPELAFNKEFDEKSGFRTRSVLAVPIKFKEVFLGVLQALNAQGGNGFSDSDLRRAEELASLLGQKFRYELRGTKSPYDHLIISKLISADALQTILERANTEGASPPELLMKEAGISKQQLGESLSRYYQVPFMAFDPYHAIPPELLKGINLSYLRQNVWVPIEGSREDEVTVLIDDPSDAQRIMEVQHTLPAVRYAFRVGLTEDILKFLGQGGSTNEAAGDLKELVGKLQEEVTEEIEDDFDEATEDDSTVIQLVNRIIAEAFQARASDIHIEPGKGSANASVRFRVDGACRSALSIPHSHTRAVVSRIKIMSALDISERRKPQDGKCTIKFKGNPLELRVATVPTVNGEGVVMRILASSEPLPLAKLNFSERNLRELQQAVSHPHGVVLVVGPTGSGKTTTLHAILGHLNTPDVKIWTAEDPVEITQRGLQQVQVRPEIGLTFAAALRSFLRADPDIIMIGEMRDYETAHIGVEASLTGHLVFSTLHTNSAPETVSRLLDLGLDPVGFSDALQAVLAQRLVRTLCEECKKAKTISDDEYTTLERYYGEERFSELGVERGKSEIFEAVGCAACGATGYRGRTGIHELLVTSPELKASIYHKGTASEIREIGLNQGMRTLMQDGIRKLFQGQTDLAQIRKVAGS